MRNRLSLILSLLAILLAGCGSPLALSSPTSTSLPTATPPPTPLPSPTPRPAPQFWLRNTTLLTVYGRGFGIAPILGMLGSDGSMDDLARQAQPYLQGINASNGGKGVRLAIHLIYGLATPCGPHDNCLAYLDDAGTDIVKQYIQPAARRGWMVVLDDQLGLSTPAAEMRRIIAKGYLRYDNVAVALDPEFRTRSAAQTPGIPVGSVSAAEINAAAREMSAYAEHHYAPHRRLLLVHQFQVPMIANRRALQTDLPSLDTVIIADGFGDPGTKAAVYEALFGPHTPPIHWRGIKLFFPNPYEQAGHGDNPMMTWQQVFGRASAYYAYDGRNYWVRPPPSVVIIA